MSRHPSAPISQSGERWHYRAHGLCGNSTARCVPSIPSLTSEEWVMDLSGYLTDGTVTTNSSGLTDPGGKAFVAGQSKLSTNQTTAHTLTSSQFTELEYSLRSTLSAQGNLTYCFRLTNAG